MVIDKQEFYTRLLGISSPWLIKSVTVDESESTVFVRIGAEAGARLVCPQCDCHCPGYDLRIRRWRHLDTCEYRTMVWAEVPRIKCPEHGCLTVLVPWAEPGRRYTNAFEMHVMQWLRETSIHVVSRKLELSPSAIDGITQHVMERAIAGWLPTQRVRQLVLE